MTTQNFVSFFEDKKSLESLYKRLFPSIEKYVLNNSGNTQDAKDIFQESLITAYKKVLNPDFKLSSSIDTFVYSIAKNKWMDILRRTKKMVKTVEPEVDDPKIDEILVEDERRKLFMSHFKKLSEGCKNLFTHFFAGMSMENIAIAMNLGSAGYARKKKHLCQEKLITRIKSDPLYNELKNG